ncbi:MAG: cbb3-type cytochrome c oxidase subunit I [Beijerinckiaceae bacterium]
MTLVTSLVSGYRDGDMSARSAAYAFSRRELTAWAWLSVGALAIAGLFAVLLATSRLPGIERIAHWPLGFFGNALVIHVIFSLVIWLLAMFAMVASFTTANLPHARLRAASLGPVGQAFVALSFPCLFSPAFADSSTSELTNYIPMIKHPIYDVGLVLLALGILGPVARMLLNVARPTSALSGREIAIVAAGIIYIVAILCFGIAAIQLHRAYLLDTAREYLFWGGGHLLQFVYVTMMIAIWSTLARTSFGERASAGPAVRLCAVLLAAASLGGPVFFMAFDSFSVPLHEAFRLLQFILAVPALLFAITFLAIAVTERSLSKWPWREPAFVTLATALALYGVGGMMGILITGSDTRTPAHYHAMVTAVSVSCMGYFLTQGFEILGRHQLSARAINFIVLCYGGGQMFASIGLFLAGGYGAQRKTPVGGAKMLDGAVIGMYLHGIGALFAVVGGALFVIFVMRALMRPLEPTPRFAPLASRL